MLKAFKYFDLNNNGTVEPEEFAKAIEKIGIMIPTRQVSKRPRSPTYPRFLINIISFTRTWTPYSACMTVTAMAHLTTRNSLAAFTAVSPVAAAQLSLLLPAAMPAVFPSRTRPSSSLSV